MRKTPKIEIGNELMVLQEGDKVNILGESEGFYKIKFKGATGYVVSEYCIKEV
jgi:ribosomal protein L21E